MNKKLIIFMLLLLSMIFIICFNIKKVNVEKDTQYIKDKVDNEVIESENKKQTEKTEELEENIDSVTITEESNDEFKEEVKESNSNNDSNYSDQTSNKSNNSDNSDKKNTADKSNNSSDNQNNNQNEIGSDNSNVDITDNKSDQVTEEDKNEESPQQKEQIEESSDNSVDVHHLDYPTHKGRIDCVDYNKCMDESLTIYFSYKKIISNVFYVEVKSNGGSTLGYFTEYVFKEYTYSSVEECQRVGSEIKNLLSDRITGYECDSSGLLKIKTDY